jgi:hypothetical protein
MLLRISTDENTRLIDSANLIFTIGKGEKHYELIRILIL